MTLDEWNEIHEKVMKLFNQMEEQQRRKALKTANRFRPDLSEDDLRDPHSFPDVARKPEYAFEDGILAGIISSQQAMLTELRALKPES